MKLINKVKVKLPTIYTLFEEGEQINNIASKRKGVFRHTVKKKGI